MMRPGGATVPGDGRFVVVASAAHLSIGATAGRSSIATTASPSVGTARCSNEPSDASAENSFRIPSADTLGFAVAALEVPSSGCYW